MPGAYIPASASAGADINEHQPRIAALLGVVAQRPGEEPQAALCSPDSRAVSIASSMWESAVPGSIMPSICVWLWSEVSGRSLCPHRKSKLVT